MIGRPLLLAVAASFAGLQGLARPACAQDPVAARVAQALDAARPALVGHLKAACDLDAQPGELALVLLAATHDGLDQTDAVYAKALQRLRKADPSETYDLALRLMVLEAVPDFPDRAKVAIADAKELLRHRHRGGPFGYGADPGGWDLSNTQYGALGLRAARALGVEIERTVWTKLADTIANQQNAQGGFHYGRSDSGFDAYASMTAAGIAVLAICRQELGAGTGAAKSLDAKIERGWKWLARNQGAIGSPKERWSFYFHYGLERAAILCDVTKVGTLDWYEYGARMFVDLQEKGGGWSSTSDGHPGGHLSNGRGDLVPTSFAVLFLRRKFQKLGGPVAGAITPNLVMLAELDARSGPADVDACAAELVRRGKPALPEVFGALRSEHEPRRRAAAAALHRIAGDTFGYDATKDAAANRDAVTKAELWYLRNR